MPAPARCHAVAMPAPQLVASSAGGSWGGELALAAGAFRCATPCAFCGEWLPGAPPWRLILGTPRAWEGLGVRWWSAENELGAWVTTCDWRRLDHVEQELRRGRQLVEAGLWDLDVVYYGGAWGDRPGVRHGRAMQNTYASAGPYTRWGGQPTPVPWCCGAAL